LVKDAMPPGPPSSPGRIRDKKDRFSGQKCEIGARFINFSAKQLGFLHGSSAKIVLAPGRQPRGAFDLRILIADDHHLIREAFAAYLGTLIPGCAVEEAATLADALQRAAEGRRFDAVLLDYQMPGMTDLSGIGEVRSALGDVPVIILSGNIDDAATREALRLGARGVLSKDMKASAVADAIARIMAGEIVAPARANGHSSKAGNTGGRQRTSLGRLSPRENAVLDLLGEGLSNRDIAARLSLAESTVKVHLRRAFAKISARNRADAVRILMESRATA
jgi:DNA-binding NarL/FixJ family response regulator